MTLWVIGGIILAQGAWILTVAVQLVKIVVESGLHEYMTGRRASENLIFLMGLLILEAIVAAPCIGGLITIVKMMRRWGDCSIA